MDRRSFLAGSGLVVGGGSVGLLGRPVLDDLLATAEPIRSVSVDDRRVVTITLAKSPEIAGVVVADADGSTVADWFHIPAAGLNLITDPLDPGLHRVLALRGETPAEDETVQEVSFSV